jgi:glycosyltransferase involved in cell wall biosynthesis
MRVALLSANAQAGDAIGNNVAAKVRFFRETGAEVRAFVESDRRLHPEVAPHASVLAAEPRGEGWRFLRSADLVSVEFGHHYALLSLLPLLAGGKPRLLVDYHGITPPELWGGHNCEALVQGLQQRGLTWYADATVTHSTYTQDELHAVTALPRARLPRLGFPVDGTVFAPGEPAHDWRRSLGLRPARVLLYVGRLAPNKRPALLVEALAHLADLDPPVHAVFVGDGSDLYQAEAQRCRERAIELGLEDRLHLVGPQLGRHLRDFYRGADALVVPSAWESFCIPVVEAMACGLPVVASRCTALPETIGGAGLTFTPGDAADLARQVRRVLAPQTPATGSPRRVAVVACRFGADFASGAEASLRRMAHALREAGCGVEVFTTCTRSEDGRTRDLRAGTATEDGLTVHRFAVDEGVAPTTPGQVPAHPIHSRALVEALAGRVPEFDAVVTGPYLAGVAVDVAARWPERTFVVPCFHDEATARLECWQALYGRVAGVLYHSPEEQAFAEAVLGLNHPGAAVVGTWLDTQTVGDAARGRAVAGAERYVLYCGRLASEKNVPLLFDFARRYHAEHPGEVRFAFTGQGGLRVPREPWAVDLGFVTSEAQRDLLAGALALVQLSQNESLSLAALEGWAQGTPVVAHRGCAALAGHIDRGDGGALVESYEEFAAALDVLVQRPEQRDAWGAAGQQYVHKNYGDTGVFQGRLVAALHDARRPLPELMRERGLARAAKFDPAAWRRQFGAVVENVLHGAPAEGRQELLVQPRSATCNARQGATSVLVAVRVVNRGTRPAVAEGPGRTELTGEVVDAAGDVVGRVEAAPLPALLAPGRALSASVAVPVPAAAGTYDLRLAVRRCDCEEASGAACIRLTVDAGTAEIRRDGCAGILDEAQAALAQVNALRRLPDDYTDVTEGAFATLKRRLKGKLLGNFKKAYVDVLSRQQSACNEQLLAAVQALTECCATLDHAVRTLQERVAQLEKPAREDDAAPAGREAGWMPVPRI